MKIIINGGGSGGSGEPNKAIVTTVAGLRALETVYADALYVTTDYGGGQWYWDEAATSVDNTGSR
jgi:hypothetical protein